MCRDCHQLGPGELAFRQAVTNIDLALRYGELIAKRHRPMVESLARHEDTRIRAYAASVIERDAAARRELADAYRDDDRVLDVAATELSDTAASADGSLWDGYGDDIPF